MDIIKNYINNDIEKDQKESEHTPKNDKETQDKYEIDENKEIS